MNWFQKTSNLPIRIVDECTGHHNQQTDCVLKAYLDDRLVGYLSYAVFEGDSHIQHVEVAKDMHRQGIATQLFRRLEEESEGEIIHTMQTPVGSDWVNSLK
jgi:ribosomal protein S18 acetylase RimI-like enzyme